MVYLKENSRALPTGLIIGAGKQPNVKITSDLETIDLLYRGRKNDHVHRIEVISVVDLFVFCLYVCLSICCFFDGFVFFL